MRDATDRARRVLSPAIRLARPALRKARSSLLSERDRRANAWVAEGLDRTLRQEYPLGRDALVFDLGGYEGQWASDIFARYLCQVWVFEPVTSFAGAIARRFEKNPNVRVFDFGLAGTSRREELLVAADRSSTHIGGKGPYETIELVEASEFLRSHDVENVDLMKINIEGGEYELLEHLMSGGWISRIADIQVQFHDFFPDAAERMHKIQRALSETHHPTYQSHFVWENWRRR